LSTFGLFITLNMMVRIKTILQALLILFLFLGTSSTMLAQTHEENVEWATSVEQIGSETVLVMTAKIGDGWHLYAQKQASEDGPIPTSFSFEKNESYRVNGEVVEGQPVVKYDSNFDMQLRYFKKEATFKQTINTTGNTPFIINGEVEYMICNEEMCLPPTVVDLQFDINPSKAEKLKSDQ
jgi:DsbC/DsbD-like thiol-disulfide interchange protein